MHLKSDGSTVDLEQAFLTYDLGGGLNVTGGKYLSLLGYEGDEPYKLYQRSMAYKWADGANNKIPFAAYHQGVKIAFSSGDLSGAISVVDDVYNSGGSNDGDSKDVGFEAQIKYTGLENFTIAIGTAQSGSGDVTAATTAAKGNNTTDDYYNFWVEYGGIDSLILGAEYNSYKAGATGGTDGDSWMLMGNYSVNEKLGVTLRLSEVEEGTTYEADKFTISPSYSFSDSLLGRIEYSTGEIDGDDADYFSIEALFTF
ncbi:MAG: outer membrane beta-barrel protein [Opitutae bacterium]|nr:outer membrane beta-barrel protein [Opitutae bacterium]